MNKKIRLVIAINDLFVGGAQRLVVDQLKIMNKELFDITLLTLYENAARPNLYHEIPSDIEIVRLHFRSVKDIQSWITTFRFLWTMKPHVVVSHLYLSNLVTRVIKIFCGYRVLVVEHNTYNDRHHMQILLDRLLSLLTYRIVAVSKAVHEFLISDMKLPPDKIITIHNGISLDVLRIKAESVDINFVREKLGVGAHVRFVVNVARLTQQKNHRGMIESFAKFTHQYPNYHLIILGDGALEDDLHQLVYSLGLLDRVHLLGYVSDPTPYYMVSDFFFSMSFIEGLSIAYLEAMAAHLPLVATKTAGTDELIIDGHNGYVVGDFSSTAGCGALEKMAQSDAVSMGQHAFESVTRFDIVTNVECYTNAIKQSLSGRQYGL